MTNITTTLVLAMSADGKISSIDPKAPSDFCDPIDFAHYEYQTSLADLVLVGANTIRINGENLIINNQELLAARKFRGQSPQPITCVVSQSLDLSPTLPFFTQEIERWIFTTQHSLEQHPQATSLSEKAKLIVLGNTGLDWEQGYSLMAQQGIRKVVALGGGSLAASLIKAGKIDDWWLTVWPCVFGGKDAPTPVEGQGFLPDDAPRLELIETRQVGNDVFLHYRMLKSRN
jgi:5-amino-6-(5-phosphoribosylamino)uracil reductase